MTAAALGKTWTTSERRLISRFNRSSGLVDGTFFQCWGEVRERRQVFLGFQQHLSDLGKLPSEHVSDGVEVGADGVGETTMDSPLREALASGA